MTSSMDEAPNSLQDWVAIKRDLFQEENSHNYGLKFLVAWNMIEQEFGITCCEGTRRASDKRAKSWACSISIQELISKHNQLSTLAPEIEPYFSPIAKMINDQQSSSASSSTYMTFDEQACKLIGNYLERALTKCGRKILLQIMFEDNPLNDYEEDIQELRLKGFENMVESAMLKLEEILKLRKNVENVLEMTTIYKIEDELVINVSIALAELYNFQLQPFIALREIASQKIAAAKEIIGNRDLGVRVKKEAEKDMIECNDQYLSSTEAIQQLYYEYYRKSLELMNDQCERMRQDQERFGKTAYEVQGGMKRLRKLEIDLSEEKLKHLSVIKVTREHQRNQVKDQIKGIKKGNGSSLELIRIEREIYEAQLSVIVVKLDILEEEEKLLRKQFVVSHNKCQEESDNGNNDVFFDAVENLDEINESVFTDENITFKQKPLNDLKVKLNEVFRKRALIRNKKRRLLSEIKMKADHIKKETINYDKQSLTQSKRKERIVIKRTNNASNNESLKEFRKKTLARLKDYKIKAISRELENQRREDCDDNSLPPYPEIKDQFIPGDGDFPPPMDCYIETSSNISPTNYFCPSIIEPPTVPPPPPPPLPASAPTSIPPPPPPPPFIFPSFSNVITTTKLKPTSSTQSSNSNSSKFTPGLVDLSELLNARKKLKAPKQVDNKEKIASYDNDSLLKATMNRIRSVTKDSESDGEESDHEDFE